MRKEKWSAAPSASPPRAGPRRHDCRLGGTQHVSRILRGCGGCSAAALRFLEFYGGAGVLPGCGGTFLEFYGGAGGAARLRCDF